MKFGQGMYIVSDSQQKKKMVGHPIYFLLQRLLELVPRFDNKWSVIL